jgi:hypothetical protein
LGTLATNVYLKGIAPLRDSLEALSPQLAEVVSNSIQAAHIAANHPLVPDGLRETILTTANHAFVNGMNTAMLISSLTMLIAFVGVLVVLPAQSRPVDLVAEGVPEGTPSPALSGD